MTACHPVEAVEAEAVPPEAHRRGSDAETVEVVEAEAGAEGVTGCHPSPKRAATVQERTKPAGGSPPNPARNRRTGPPTR